MFVTLNKCFRQSCENKPRSQNYSLTAFQVNSSQLSKILSQYWQNGNTEGRGKWLSLNYNILKTAIRRKFKCDKNAFQAFPNILAYREKLDLNAL